MPKYTVFRPIEHNNRLYLPEGTQAPEVTASASHGRSVEIDTSGVVELTEEQATAMDLDQVAPIKEHAAAARGQKKTKV